MLFWWINIVCKASYQIWICFQGHWSDSLGLCAPSHVWECNSQSRSWCSVCCVNCHTGWPLLLHYQWCRHSCCHQAVLEAVIEVISCGQNRGLDVGLLVLLETFCILHLLWGSSVNYWINAMLTVLNLQIINNLKYIAEELFITKEKLSYALSIQRR